MREILIALSRLYLHSSIDIRGRGQQFQGPGFRVFGQNLIKISTNARSKQSIYLLSSCLQDGGDGSADGIRFTQGISVVSPERVGP